MLMRELVRQNPDYYEEFVPGQPLKARQPKDPGQQQPEGGTPPDPRKENPAVSEDEGGDGNGDENGDGDGDERESLADWPLDEFGHPKPRFPSSHSEAWGGLGINPPSSRSPQSP